MNKERAAEVLNEWTAMAQVEVNRCVVSFECGVDEVEEALDMAVAVLEGKCDG